MISYCIYNFGYRTGYKKISINDIFSSELTNVYFM